MEDLTRYLEQGEGVSLEFKRCGGQPGRDVFETVCAFANRQGGSILLGVRDDGEVEGVREDAVLAIERNIVNVVCDPALFSSAPSVEFEKLRHDGKTVLRVWVPMGPTVYQFKGASYDRRADVDVRVKDVDAVAALFVRKNGYFTERRVLPAVTMDDLRRDLMPRVRDLMARKRRDHPWLGLSDEELLRDAQLYRRDAETGEEGLTLAAVMLLGSDEVIRSVCPVYRTDALLRRLDRDRYDDRLTVTTNLIEAYDQLVDFCDRWLPDSFALEGKQRVSPRDVIVRELVTNCLVHREFSSHYLSRIEIGLDGIRTSNPSRCLIAGPITPDGAKPMPKNPAIAHFFAQLGRGDELGSGTRNLYKYSRLYTGKTPTLEDGDFFEAFVPMPPVMGLPVAESAEAAEAPLRRAARKESLDYAIVAIVREEQEMSAADVAEAVEANPRTVRRHLAKLVEAGTLLVRGKGRSTTYIPA